MVIALQRNGTAPPPPLIHVDKNTLFQSQLSAFVRKNCANLYLSNNSNSTFIEAREKLQRLKVDNDLAQRIVVLLQAFNNVLTKQEGQK